MQSKLTPTPEGRLHTPNTHAQIQGDKLNIRLYTSHPRPKGVFTPHTSHPAPFVGVSAVGPTEPNLHMPLRCLMWCSYFLNCQQ
jgi:hypothetical protein